MVWILLICRVWKRIYPLNEANSCEDEMKVEFEQDPQLKRCVWFFLWTVQG